MGFAMPAYIPESEVFGGNYISEEEVLGTALPAKPRSVLDVVSSGVGAVWDRIPSSGHRLDDRGFQRATKASAAQVEDQAAGSEIQPSGAIPYNRQTGRYELDGGVADFAGDVGAAVLDLPQDVAATARGAIIGNDPRAVAESDLIKAQNARGESRSGVVRKYGLGLDSQDIQSSIQSLPFSLASMAAYLGASIPTALVSKNPVAANAAGMAASGAAAYRMDTAQVLGQVYGAANKEFKRQTGRDMTPSEFEDFASRPDVQGEVRKHGAAEAGFEALGNFVTSNAFAGAIKGSIGKAAAKEATDAISTKAADSFLKAGIKSVAGELATETPTQIAQSQAETALGLQGGPAPEWTNPDDWAQAFKEVAWPTLLTSGAMGGAAKIAERPLDAFANRRMAGKITEFVTRDGHLLAGDSDLAALYARAKDVSAARPDDAEMEQAVKTIQDEQIRRANSSEGYRPGADTVRADDVLGTPSPEQSEAEKALYTPKSLTALDRVNEIDTRLAAATPEESSALQAERDRITESWPTITPGAETSFTTEAGARLAGQYALVEAESLVTSHDENLRPVAAYPAELQPRERERHASEMQIQQIVGRLDPARLGESADVSTGAPIVGADGLVESGNARTIALKRVYQANGAKADGYRAFLKANAERFGITAESVDAMQKPVLVRVRNTPVNRAEFARQANAATVARMSPSEQAKSDAAQIDSLDDLNPDEAGEFMSGSSAPFVRRFLSKLAGTESAGLVDASGRLSQAGYTRIRNAVLAKAYGDSPVLLRMVESLDDNTRNVSKALLRVAPQVAKAREAIGEGALFDVDITPDLMAAVEELSDIKEKGGSVEDALAQAGMFGEKLSPEARELLVFLNDNIRSPKRIADFIQAYLDGLVAAGNPAQGSMFGDSAAPAKQELIAAARGTGDATRTTENAGRGQPGEDRGAGSASGGQSANSAVNQSRNGGNEAAGKEVGEWALFGPETGTIGIPRSEMPQVKGEHRGALIQFLAGKGITHETVELPASDLKPTQAEYSPEKVAKWAEKREGVDRSVLASSDGYILDGHHQWVYAREAGETEQVIRFNAPIRELLAATFQFPSVRRSEGANVVELRAKNQQEMKEALADLALIASKHTRAAMLPEDTPNLMPTLIKLSSAAISEVGYQVKDIIAHVKKALHADSRLKAFWNKIGTSTYRKAAEQAAAQESAAHVDDLFSAAEARRGQGDLFARRPEDPQVKQGVAMIDGRPYDRARDNFKAPHISGFLESQTIDEANAAVEKYYKGKPGVVITAEERARAEALLTPLIAKAEAVKEEYDQKIIDITKRSGAIGQMLAPIKSMKRSVEKLVDDEDFDIGGMKDVLRSTIVVSSYADVQAVMNEIEREFSLLRDPKNRTGGAPIVARGKTIEAENPKIYGGYSDVMVNVVLPSGVIAEIQINVPEMLGAKEGPDFNAPGHKLYEAYREAPKESPLGQEIKAEMEKYYAAVSSAISARKSASDRSHHSETGPRGPSFGLNDNSLPSSESLYHLPSGNSTKNPPSDLSPNLQPSGNLSGTRISSTSNDIVADDDQAAYNLGKNTSTGSGENGNDGDGKAGTESKGSGAVSGAGGSGHAAGVSGGPGRGNQSADSNADGGTGGPAGGEQGQEPSGKGGNPKGGGRDGNGNRSGRNAPFPLAEQLANKVREVADLEDKVINFGKQKTAYAREQELEDAWAERTGAITPMFSRGDEAILKPVDTKSAEFAAWSRGASVRSKGFKTGQAAVAKGYHGTQGDIYAFDPDAAPNTFEGDRGLIFVTSANKKASGYAEDNGRDEQTSGANVMPVFVAMASPKVVTIEGMKTDASEYYDEHGHYLVPDAKDAGHDGLIIENLDTGELLFVAFRNTQVKSAISNTGAFDSNNSDIRYSRGSGRGMALRDLQATVDRVSRGFKNLPRVHVMESPASLSTKDPAQKALRDYIRKSGAWDDVEGATHEGEIYLFASGLADEARAEHVLATHEVTHYGLRGAVGADLDTALQHVLLMNARIRKAAVQLKTRLGLKSNLDAIEEVLADLTPGELMKLRGWRKVVQVVRNWLNKAGAKNLAARLDVWMKAGLTDQEQADLFVADLVNAARDWVRSGKGKAIVPGTKLAEQKLSDDWAAQEKWLAKEAKARGYKSIDDLAEKAYPVFEKLAALWRKKNPVEVALMSRKASDLRVVDLFGSGSRVQHFDDKRGLFYEAQKYPSGRTGWRAGEVIDGVDYWLSAKEFGSMAEAQAAVRGLRISNTAKQNSAEKYGAIPALWTGEARRVAKAIIDAGVGVERFSASTQSKSKYAYLDSGLKVRLADHALPGAYDQPDVDYRYGGDIKALVAEIKEVEEGAPTPDSGELGSRSLGETKMQERPTVRADKSGSSAEPAQSGSGAGSNANVPLFSRAVPPSPTIRNSQTAPRTADDIINKKAGTPRPMDAVLKGATQAVKLDRATTAIYDRAAFLLDRITPEIIKAGMVSDYGVPAAVIDARAVMQGRQRQQLRAAGALLEKLSTLTRAESRVAYEWMNSDNPQAADYFREQLPPESIKTLAEVEKMIDDLSKEAIKLGQLDPDAYARNKFAYLRRSYVKHTAELTAGEAKGRGRAIAVLGDQYKGRGMTDSAPMSRIRNVAPEWWNRKTQAGKADKQLRGERFIRLERRQAVGQGVSALPGFAAGGKKPKLLEINYWPANEPMPARYGAWDQAGTWEVRDTKGGDLILWRDFSKQEREALGEIDEARFAIAKTLHGMIHDVETGKYLQWLGQKFAKKEGEAIDGEIVEAAEGMFHTFGPGDWVKVPDSVITGTRVKKYGALAGRYLPGPIWNDVRQLGNFRPLGNSGVANVYSAIHRAWKTSKTALSPAVHMNNVMANFVMADWHDVTAGHVAKALRLVLSKEAGAQEVLARFGDSGGTIGTWATKELQQEQLRPILDALEKELGIAGNAAGQVGVMYALQMALRGRLPTAWTALSPTATGKAAKAAARAMLDLYEAEDQVFRLAAWLKAKEEGASDLAAGKVARRSFLDYSINAPWVQMLRSTALPFVAFTYRSVPMLLEIAAKKPWKLMKLGLLAGAVNAFGYMLSGGDEDDERKLLPEEKAGRIWGLSPKLVRMPWNDDHGSPVFLDVRRWIPVGDIFDTGQSHAAVPLLPSMTPGGPMVLVAEIALNKQQFTGKEIALDTDTPAERAGKVVDYLWKAFAPNIAALPGTYAWTGIANAGGGKTDAFGREQSLPQAIVSSIGIKVGSYPGDVLRVNAQRETQAKMMEIDRNITALKRERQKNGIDDAEFQEKAGAQMDKKRRVIEEFQRRAGS